MAKLPQKFLIRDLDFFEIRDRDLTYFGVRDRDLAKFWFVKRDWDPSFRGPYKHTILYNSPGIFKKTF